MAPRAKPRGAPVRRRPDRRVSHGPFPVSPHLVVTSRHPGPQSGRSNAGGNTVGVRFGASSEGHSPHGPMGPHAPAIGGPASPASSMSAASETAGRLVGASAQWHAAVTTAAVARERMVYPSASILTTTPRSEPYHSGVPPAGPSIVVHRSTPAPALPTRRRTDVSDQAARSGPQVLSWSSRTRSRRVP